METAGLVLYSKELMTEYYPEPDEATPYFHMLLYRCQFYSITQFCLGPSSKWYDLALMHVYLAASHFVAFLKYYISQR
jgi:hypothetical protein